MLSPTDILIVFLLLSKLLSQASKSDSQYLNIYHNEKTPDCQLSFSNGMGRFPHTLILFPNSTANDYFCSLEETNNLCMNYNLCN